MSCCVSRNVSVSGFAVEKQADLAQVHGETSLGVAFQGPEVVKRVLLFLARYSCNLTKSHVELHAFSKMNFSSC